MDPKTGPHSGSQKVRCWCYLLYLSKVRNGPHFGSCLKTSFAQNTKKWGNGGCPKIGAEKRSPSAKMAVYLRIRRLPDSPLARPEQETIWATTATTTATVAAAVAQCWFFLLNVDFCFQNCPVLDETCKKRMLLIVRIQRPVIWHALGQGPANFLVIALWWSIALGGTCSCLV